MKGFLDKVSDEAGKDFEKPLIDSDLRFLNAKIIENLQVIRLNIKRMQMEGKKMHKEKDEEDLVVKLGSIIEETGKMFGKCKSNLDIFYSCSAHTEQDKIKKKMIYRQYMNHFLNSQTQFEHACLTLIGPDHALYLSQIETDQNQRMTEINDFSINEGPQFINREEVRFVENVVEQVKAITLQSDKKMSGYELDKSKSNTLVQIELAKGEIIKAEEYRRRSNRKTCLIILAVFITVGATVGIIFATLYG